MVIPVVVVIVVVVKVAVVLVRVVKVDSAAARFYLKGQRDLARSFI